MSIEKNADSSPTFRKESSQQKKIDKDLRMRTREAVKRAVAEGKLQ